jgi:hypothetical protein
MIIIEIDSTATKEKSGISKKTGEVWKMVFQQISISGHHQDGFPAKYPRETTILLDSEKPVPHPVGRYALAADSYYFGDFDKFMMGRIELIPLNAFCNDLQKQLGVSITQPQPKAA